MEEGFVKTMGILAERVYDSELFALGKAVEGYEVRATSPKSSNGFQALMLEKTDPNTAGSQYVIAFRETEGNPPFLHLSFGEIFS